MNMIDVHRQRSSTSFLCSMSMFLLALYPILCWYEIPFPITLGTTLILAVAVVGVAVSGFRGVRMLPLTFYVLMVYVMVMWSYHRGMTVKSLLPPGGMSFFIFLVSLLGCVALFDLQALRRYRGRVVVISVPLFLIQFVVLHTTGEAFCLVPNLTGKFSYEDMTYAEVVKLHVSRDAPSSIFLEKSYMAYYLVTYLCLRLFSPDVRDKLMSPVNIILVLTLLLLRSGSGVLGLSVLFAVKVIQMLLSGSNKKRMHVLIFLIPVLVGASYVYLRSEIGTAMYERTSELDTKESSGYTRVVGGYVVYGMMPLQEQLFGTSRDEIVIFSDDKSISDDRFYVNGIQTILLTLGAVGFLLYLVFYGSVFRRGDMLVKMSIITLLLFSLLESDYLNPYHLLLTVIPCAMSYLLREKS